MSDPLALQHLNIRLFLCMALMIDSFQADSRRGSENELLDEITALKGGGRSEVETEALVKHLNWYVEYFEELNLVFCCILMQKVGK